MRRQCEVGNVVPNEVFHVLDMAENMEFYKLAEGTEYNAVNTATMIPTFVDNNTVVLVVGTGKLNPY